MEQKRMRRAWTRRTTVVIVALAAIGAISGPGGTVAAQAATPTVTVTAQSGGAIQDTDCKGTSRNDVTSPIRLTVGRSGDTTGPLTVGLSYQGTLAATSGLPVDATIPAGASQVQLTAAGAESGSLFVTVLPSSD